MFLLPLRHPGLKAGASSGYPLNAGTSSLSMEAAMSMSSLRLQSEFPAKVRRLRAGRCPNPVTAIIDFQSVRAAATVTGRSRSYDAGKKVQGRERHLVVDTKGLMLGVMVTPAGQPDRDAARELLARLRMLHPQLTLIWGDSAYAGNAGGMGSAVPAPHPQDRDGTAGSDRLDRRALDRVDDEHPPQCDRPRTTAPACRTPPDLGHDHLGDTLPEQERRRADVDMTSVGFGASCLSEDQTQASFGEYSSG
ncbi:transposase [Nonomuraea zeae]|uniref:Transposase n=1 Tax=Nonomuraea zeae TaxID=1642303 RepID=A0A5S4FL42_9ACTN|nr:transposase [Nonomuraea zeae]TMR21309.1 transposase [Nonomuraea zeae]